MIDIDTLTDAEFDALPLVVEGESKIVRDAGDGLCVIRFKPTIYSFTNNRSGVVPGSEVLRLRASRIFVDVLREHKIEHAYRQINDRFVLADLIASPPPIEVVVKQYHTGTSKHRYHGMSQYPVRESHPYYPSFQIRPDDAYPCEVVRFDWRNPLQRPGTLEKLADEPLCEVQANWFLNIARARLTALMVFRQLSRFLARKNIVLYDLCLFITEDGGKVFGEISQDCGRFRHFDMGSLDKDVWRAGGSSEHVMEKWMMLLDLMQREG